VRSKFQKLYFAQLICFIVICSPLAVRAAESQFAFIYTTDLLPKGEKEIEQWVTWRHDKIAGIFNLVEGRTAVEYGVSDSFQLALYASYAWKEAAQNGPNGVTTPPEQFLYDTPKPNDYYSATRFIGGSLEGIYRVLSPYVDPLGLALYLEPTFGPQFTEFEAKIILQKNFLDDLLTFDFNFTYAPEYRLVGIPGSLATTWQEETDTNYYFGGSYRFISNWSAGFEFLNEHEYNSYDFSHESNNASFIGPSIHFGGKDFFATLVFLKQLPWATENSDTVNGAVIGGRSFDNDFEMYRLRLKLGFYF
jgi:hypothetical protein